MHGDLIGYWDGWINRCLAHRGDEKMYGWAEGQVDRWIGVWWRRDRPVRRWVEFVRTAGESRWEIKRAVFACMWEWQHVLEENLWCKTASLTWDKVAEKHMEEEEREIKVWRRMTREVEGLRGREQGVIEDTEGCCDATRKRRAGWSFERRTFPLKAGGTPKINLQPIISSSFLKLIVFCSRRTREHEHNRI